MVKFDKLRLYAALQLSGRIVHEGIGIEGQEVLIYENRGVTFTVDGVNEKTLTDEVLLPLIVPLVNDVCDDIDRLAQARKNLRSASPYQPLVKESIWNAEAEASRLAPMFDRVVALTGRDIYCMRGRMPHDRHNDRVEFGAALRFGTWFDMACSDVSAEQAMIVVISRNAVAVLTELMLLHRAIERKVKSAALTKHTADAVVEAPIKRTADDLSDAPAKVSRSEPFKAVLFLNAAEKPPRGFEIHPAIDTEGTVYAAADDSPVNID